MLSKLIALYFQELPAFFPGNQIDTLTAKAIRWRSLQNKRSRGEIPQECFLKISPRKVLIIRDTFLTWLAGDIALHGK